MVLILLSQIIPVSTPKGSMRYQSKYNIFKMKTLYQVLYIYNYCGDIVC